MTPIVQIVSAAVAFASIAAFALYVASLIRLEISERPETPTIDRFGRELPPSPNPGYAETEEETEQQ